MKLQSPSSKVGSGPSRQHTKEIYGLIFLALGVFVVLCLLSYDALDPSFTALSHGRRIQNLGGVVGAHLADLLFNLCGYGGYLVPLALFSVSFTHFAQRNVAGFRLGWKRIGSYLGVIVGAALFFHLKFGEVDVGGRLLDAGGILGWWLGSRLVRFFGRTGGYLLVLSGFLLSILFITEGSLLRVLEACRVFGLLLLQKTQRIIVSFSVVAWARTRMGLSRLAEEIRLWWKMRKGPTVHTPEKTPSARPAPVLKVIPTKTTEGRPPSGVSDGSHGSPDEGLGERAGSLPDFSGRTVSPPTLTEPKILPRVDLKENKKNDQLELIVPKVTDYQMPQISFLDSESQVSVKIDEDNLKLNSKLLEKKLMDYGVEGRITEIHPGPIITMYEFEPASGVKVNKIVNLEDDLALTMGGKSVRIIAPLPGKAAVGIEIPNNVRETVWLKDIIGHAKFQKTDSKLTLAFGKDTEGIPFVADLAKMPHLLVAGATGSGKSVSVNAMILSLLYKGTPEEVKLVLIDLKMLELSIYEGIPHLLLPVVTSPRKASLALRWAVTEMERRYEILAKKAVRNIAGYNKAVSREEKLPYLVLIIDELADLIMTAAKDVEVSITRLAQMARAAGIHLILATQRPSVDVLTGLIKANFPARISFKVTSKHDSRTIIDTVGSEHLLGSGDMLFMSGGTSNLLRIHGAYVSETEILRVVDHWKSQGEPKYLDESVLRPMEEEAEKGSQEDLSDELYDQAVSIVAETRQASISMIQRRLRIGYNRAARMIERMEKEGVVGPADGAKPREVYVSNFGREGQT